MILPVVLISATIFISASLGSEESCYLTEEQEDECASVCYPIVKPLLRYFEKCQSKEAQLQKDYSELEKMDREKSAQIIRFQMDHSAVLRRLNEVRVKYERLQSKHLQVDHFEALINQKNVEINLLKNQISDLKKSSELEMLTNKFSKDLKKFGEIIETGEKLTKQLTNFNNQTKCVTQVLPDTCPLSQKEGTVLQEIQIPGSDPIKVVCGSDRRVGSGWMLVYGKPYKKNYFNRTYEEYAKGFGNAGLDYKDEFFIGLDTLHHLTNEKPHEMFFKDRKITCDNFVIGNRQEGYMLKDLGECTEEPSFILKKGTKFSTFDRDQDGVSNRNLAKEFGIGWWFHSEAPIGSYNWVYMHIRKKN